MHLLEGSDFGHFMKSQKGKKVERRTQQDLNPRPYIVQKGWATITTRYVLVIGYGYSFNDLHQSKIIYKK